MLLSERHCMFGFVRFMKEVEASNAIVINNGLVIKGSSIRVSWLKYCNGVPTNN